MYRFHYDAGHGWLEVDESDITRHGMTLADFSSFSYKEGTTVYLEEDCDAWKFAKASDAFCHTNLPFSDVVEVNDGHNSFIRDLPHLHR